MRFLSMVAASIAVCVAACSETPSADPTPAFAPPLWVVTDEDSTLYLYGTIHVRKPGAPWGDAVVKDALAEADAVWTEVLDEELAQDNAAAVVARLGLSLDAPLSSVLPEDLHSETVAAASKLGIGEAQLEPMRPWLVALTLAVEPILRAGYDPEAGVDKAVTAAAKAAGARMKAFETLDQQMRFFADLTPETQIALLRDTLADIDIGPDVVADLEAAWERGDVDRLETLVAVDMKETSPALYAALIRDRNMNWLDALEVELEGEGVGFVAVGAGHLVGFDGLPQQLANRGYAVERVATGTRLQ